MQMPSFGEKLDREEVVIHEWENRMFNKKLFSFW